MSEPTSFYGPLTGQQYETAAARDHYESFAAKRLAAETTDDPLAEGYIGPTADDIKRAHELAQAATRDAARDLGDDAAARVFVELRPDYIACPENMRQMQAYFDLKGRPLDRSIRVEELETAADYLTQRGLLKLNPEAIATERKAEAREMADEIKQARRNSGLSRSGLSSRTVSRSVQPTYSEDDLYDMDLDQLRALALKESGESEAW